MVTMRVPNSKVLDLQRPPPFCEGRDLARDVPAYSEGAKGVPRAEGGGGGVLGQSPIRSGFCWLKGGGGGVAKGLLPCFTVPNREAAHGLHPRVVVAEIWANGAQRGRGGGGGYRRAG